MRIIDADHTDIFAPNAEGSSDPAPLRLDPAKYRDEVDAFDITEEQKQEQELLWTLWSIMRSFVELGQRRRSLRCRPMDVDTGLAATGL